MRRLLIAGLAAAALSATAPATPAGAETCYVADIDYCELRDSVRDPVTDFACHLLWPTLYRLGYRYCPV